MRARSLSAVAIVVVGLLPTLVGGPFFALLMAAIGVLAMREYLALATRLPACDAPPNTGYAVVGGLALAALGGAGAPVIVAIAMLAVALPFVAVVMRAETGAAFVDWSIASAGALYLGLPVYAAIALRGLPGSVDAAWLTGLADRLALAWATAPRGLAWTLLVVLATWLGDTSAYLVGPAIGRRPLAPRISPKKTVEGSLAGLVASALVGAVAIVALGLGLSPLVGFVLGAILGAVGQLADLSKSVLKRQVGVKDSGTLIPGHGGVLDRVDALLFAFPTGWLMAALLDRTAG